MPTISPFPRVLLFLVATNLVMADVFRLAISNPYQDRCFENLIAEHEEDIPADFSYSWEEEVKIPYSHEQFKIAAIRLFGANKTNIGHLIKDDVVHLSGFVSIFSPPPNYI